MEQTRLSGELNQLNHNGEIEPFRIIIDGRSNCGKTRLLIQLMKEFQPKGDLRTNHYNLPDFSAKQDLPK